ncbi:70 kDa peptidyl-prolyl isomerase [Trifolium medium]|uniref:70 kDa peptidyl-prolyl isomerase n=1 Tax=Trifolium medium TaxID=97028 RepID=A0A392PH71_9FABA|nr:70 kDa peptidyl-prolyl isomerase [Trifolium medium]
MDISLFAENKLCSVVEVFSLGWEVGGGVGLAETIEGVGGGDVGGVSRCLLALDLIGSSYFAAEDLIWHKQVPLKVSIFAWKLLRDRLPTKANLVTRGIISPEAHFCVSGCGGIESAQHLFFTCGTFGSLWSSVRLWIGFSSADPQNPSDHLIQFVDAAGGRRARRSFLQLIWLVCVWVL